VTVEATVARGNGCHVLRHTAVSTWLPAGVSLAKVAAYLGDTKETVLSVYAHFLPSDDDRAREVMNAFFAGANEGSCARNVPGKGV
jgi:integrase